MTIQHSPKPDKFRAYRARKRAAGRRLHRLWGPDLGNAAMRERLRSEGDILRARPEEKDAADFIDVALGDVLGDAPA